MKAALAKLAALLLNKKTGKKVALAFVSVVLAIILLLMSPLLILLAIADDIGYTTEQLFYVVINHIADGHLALLDHLITALEKVHDTMLMAGCTQIQVQWGQSLCMAEELLPYLLDDDFPARLTSCFTSPNMTAAELKAAIYEEFGAVVELDTLEEMRGYFFETQLPTQVLATPDTKNNLDLVAWVTATQQNGWGYVYGTFGQVLDEGLYSSKLSQYPDEIQPYEDYILANTMGRRVADCVGLIKSYMWADPDTGELGYQTNGMPDYSADTVYWAATEKGEIDTMPEIPGLLLWVEGHVGVYIGNGEAIHSAGTLYGVIREDIGNRGWTHWAKIPYIEYLEQPTVPAPTETGPADETAPPAEASVPSETG